MIIHDPRCAMRFPEFGVAIPALDSRPRRIIEALSEHPVLGPLRDRWLLAPVESPGGPAIERADLLRAHDAAYVDALLTDPEPAIIRSLELYDAQGRPNRYDPAQATRPLRELLDIHLAHAAGTLRACRTALDRGFAFFLGGGMHHAARAEGRGFCLINDVVVAIRRLQAEGRVGLAWVVDVDAHKGDGTAAICLGDASVLCLSVHMAQGWPLDEAPLDEQGRLKPAFWPSDADVPVPPGGEELYLDGLEWGLKLLEGLSRGKRPDLAVVVDGSDPYERDCLPSSAPLRLDLARMKSRDRLVHDFLAGRSVPQAWVMAGGYGEAAWEPYVVFLQDVLQTRLGLRAASHRS